VTCWGWDANNGVLRPPEQDLVDFVVGNLVCGVTLPGDVACGPARDGTSSWLSTSLDGEGPFLDVAVGDDFLCALRGVGTVLCSDGSDLFDMEGDGFRQVAASSLHVYGLGVDGNLTSWSADDAQGFEDAWRFDVGGEALDGTWSAITAGPGGTCAISDTGALSCWDHAVFHEEIPGPWTVASVGMHMVCALDSEGGMACWWDERYLEGVQPPTGTFVDVAAGSLQVCGVGMDGTISCAKAETRMTQ
jgi:hypothetical protein